MSPLDLNKNLECQAEPLVVTSWPRRRQWAAICLSLFLLFSSDLARAGFLCRNVATKASKPKEAESPPDLRRQLEEARDLIEDTQAFASLPDPVKDKRMLTLMGRALFKEKESLSPEDLQFLKSYPVKHRIYKSLQSISRITHFSARAIDSFFMLWTREGQIWTTAGREGWLEKTGGLAADTYNLILRSFLPLPRIHNPTTPIFLRQWRNPHYEPTVEEWAILDGFKARDLFLKTRHWYQDHPTWYNIRYAISGFGKVATTLLLASSLSLSVQVQRDGVIPLEEFMTEVQYQVQPHQIQLINESPVPHMAVRVGGVDRVYSYGVNFMTRSSTENYWKVSAPKQDGPPDGNFSQQSSQWASSWMTPLLQVLPRNIQVVTINLTPELVAEFKRDMELNVGKRYDNHTWTNDCLTMLIRHLPKDANLPQIPMIDASPSLFLQEVALLKSIGWKSSSGDKPLVDSIRQVSIDDHSTSRLQVLYNSVINFIEGSVALKNAAFFSLHRAYIDLNHLYVKAIKGVDALEFWPEPMKKIILQWQGDMKDQMAPLLLLIEQRRAAVAQLPPGPEQDRKRAELEATIRSLLNGQLNQVSTQLAEPDLQLFEIVQAEQKRLLLQQALGRN